jgi:type VI secretion system protein ImpF
VTDPRSRPGAVRQSILDRLVDRGWREPGDWDASVEALKANLLRDLEALLNTRESGSPATAPYVEVERSIYNYGLPDFASMSADMSTTPARLLRSIEREIELFEPRLGDVRISRAGGGEGKSRDLKFVIEATLRLDPDPERVHFDTVLEMHSGRFTVAE